jgi:glycosyltransferase involved in cell wall biosynthesis
VKFSVLLPTRKGGRFLADCIASILEQPYADMELVVSDNANNDETPAVIASFAGDARLKTVRLETPVCVTDNWNCALRASSGDYILMMGDDDCLLPGYFERVERVLAQYGNPDCITYNAYSYVAQGSINDNMQSYYKEAFFKFDQDFGGEGVLSPEMRFAIVRDMFRFRNRIPLNMQTTLIARRAADRIAGGIFQPPFPDHYALNSLLLNADTWVYVPENLLVVGVSPKSFGHFVYSDKQDEGKKYLGIESDFDGRLPGIELNNCMYVWLSRLKANYKDRLVGVTISRAAYVRRQVHSWYLQYRSGAASLGQLVKCARLLSPADWLYVLSSVFDKQSWQRLGRLLRSSKQNQIQYVWQGALPLENISTIKEFAGWISRRPSVGKS